jgi:hypothetical protein
MTEDSTAEIITPGEMKKVMEAVFKRAQTDAEFRNLCLESPREAIYQLSGKRLPADATLSFSEPTKPPDA